MKKIIVMLLIIILPGYAYGDTATWNAILEGLNQGMNEGIENSKKLEEIRLMREQERLLEEQRKQLEQQREEQQQLDQQRIDAEKSKQMSQETKSLEINKPIYQENNPDVILSSKDGSFKVILPYGWIEEANSAPRKLVINNNLIESAAWITAFNRSDVADWHKFVKYQKEKFISKLNKAHSSPMKVLKINNHDAMQVEISAILENGIKARFLGTIIKTDKHILQIVAFCLDSRFEENKQELESIPYRLQD